MIKKYIALLCVALFLNSCSLIATSLTPNAVVDSVARGDAVAQSALTNPPTSEEDLQAYFEVNAAMWNELAIFFELRGLDEVDGR